MTSAKKTSPAATLLNIIGTAIIVIAILLCLALAVPKVFGFSSYTVLTGSMEPAIPVGSIVYAKACEPASLIPGDVIVFNDGHSEIPVTHRVIQNNTSDGTIITKGDANQSKDLAPISYYNVLGKVHLDLPLIGRLLAPLGSLLGKLAMIAIVIGGALLCEIAKRIRR